MKSVSKEECLKRYLSGPSKGNDGNKKGRKKETVHYISGEMPDTLDAFDERSKLELNMFPGSDEFVLPAIRSSAFSTTTTNVRKRKEISELELDSQAEKARKKAELEAKYALWNKGIDSIKEREAMAQTERYEASKPLARYADDVDLQEHLKEAIHTDDPMAAYFKEKKEKDRKRKKKKRQKNGEEDSEGEEERKLYTGPEPPANRYNIWPGYRWDGVDRSNGFEKKIMDDTTRRKVEAELAYKWGSEDM